MNLLPLTFPFRRARHYAAPPKSDESVARMTLYPGAEKVDVVRPPFLRNIDKRSSARAASTAGRRPTGK